jgi:hypothetical protein
VKKKVIVRKIVLSILVGCAVFGLVTVTLTWGFAFLSGEPAQLWLLSSGLILGGFVGLLCGLTHEGLNKIIRNRLIRIIFEGFLGLVYGFVLGAITYGTPVMLNEQCDFGFCAKDFAQFAALGGGLVSSILGGVVGLILGESR